jgi:hypothetical protein
MRRAMRFRSLLSAPLGLAVAVGSVGLCGQAGAAANGSDGPGATVTVGASTGGSGGGASGSGAGRHGGVGGAGAADSPWVCTYTELTLNDGGGFAPGGPTPGSWYSVTCSDLLTGVSTTVTEWIPDGGATPIPTVNPYAVARQAEQSLRLPSPTNHFDPALSVVNLPTWLWIDSDLWHTYQVTASVGPVTATAVATPTTVTWSMGDGGSVTCDGPGTPFNAAEPASEQATQCDYVYLASSAGQPSPDGDPDHGSFPVVATIHWTVTWTVEGAAGGGALPALSTSTAALMRVEQVESINTESAAAPAGSGPNPGRAT